MSVDGQRGDAGAQSAEDLLLVDDFAQLEAGLNALVSSGGAVADGLVADASRPAAIFAEAWLTCGFDAGAAALCDDWQDAFSDAEREEFDSEQIAAGPAPLIRFLHPEDASPVLVLVLPLASFARWPMVARWLERRGSGPAPSHAAIRLAAMDPRQDRFNRARTIFRLSPGEERLLCRLAQTGVLRDAAVREGVTYETARTMLKDLLARSGHPRQPALVGAALKLGALDEPLELDSDAGMRQVFGLTARQSAIARLFALGRTRDEVAERLGLGIESVKAELKVIYLTLGVGNATALAAVAAQIGLAARMLAAQDLGAVDLAASAEPVRLLPRARQSGRIAFADYGPAGRIPTFHFHTLTTSRYLPRSYIAALQAQGLRPVTIDAPGFGLTDMTAGDYFDLCALDVIAVADALGARQFNVISRGARQISYLLKHCPDRLARAVVLNPEGELSSDRSQGGIQGAYKRVFYSLPGLVMPLANQLANRLSDQAIERLVGRFVAGSPADEALLADPDQRRAYVHSSRLAGLQGGKGMAAVGLSHNVFKLTPIADGSHITAICGLQDKVFVPEDTLPRLQAAWPGMQVRLVEEAGRLVHLQCPEIVAAGLLDGSRLSSPRRQSRR